MKSKSLSNGDFKKSIFMVRMKPVLQQNENMAKTTTKEIIATLWQIY